MTKSQRDPEEEFFMLAVSALKMLHNEQYDDTGYVSEISAAKLFRKVREQKLPFYKWFKWLEWQFHELREQQKKKEFEDAEAEVERIRQEEEKEEHMR